jgi:organic hydroperoxide reductase OsmC/OhrA
LPFACQLSRITPGTDIDHFRGRYSLGNLHHKNNNMAGKTSKQFFFETQLNWLTGTRGILGAKDAIGIIHVATPPEFGGEGEPWTPEHLFLGAVSSCFMTTYLAFASKMHFKIAHFECSTIGQIELIDGRYKFTNINLYPKIFIENELLREQANAALEKTHQYCLITNSINALVFYHSEVLIDALAYNKKKNIALVKKRFSLEEAKKIGTQLGIDFGQYDLKEFRRGLEVEMEHGNKTGETNITNDNEYITGKIAWAHLHEIPDYYTRLDKMEKEAEAIIKN